LDFLSDFSLEATRWLQSSYPQLRSFLVGISALGQLEFYIIVLALVYWTINKPLGRALTYMLALSDVLVSTSKHIGRNPRPYWIHPDIGLVEEASYGIPSGHAQGGTVFYLFLAGWLRRRWIWLGAILMVFLMALSRVYLGVHDIEDVVAGFLIGLVLLVFYFLIWRRNLGEKYSNRILGQRLLYSVLLPIVLLALYLVIIVVLGDANREVPWASHVDLAERTSIESAASAFAIFLGLSIGFVLEASRVRFLVTGPIWKRAARYTLGLAVTLLLWRGLDMVFPEDPLWLAIPFRVLRYFLMAIWAAYYGPMLFVRLKLADAQPKPEMSLTMEPRR
jgi:membrane-associated phospholipid phosphatase